jgi:uncharacterized protein (DUF362 family)
MENVVAIRNCAEYDLAKVKDTLSSLFMDLGLVGDNPFAAFIKPGMNVFIKPNWVASRWRKSCAHDGDIYSVITHPIVIEAVADFVALALGDSGHIYIGDNPSIDADFNELLELTAIKRLETKYRIPCTILDLRPLVCADLADYGKRERMKAQAGDPSGFVEVNLKGRSALAKVNPALFRGVFNERDETISSHSGGNQLYSFAKTLYNADVYISIPKLKTHHKVGTTLNLKGLVGSIYNKNQLVHWRVGFPLIGGDEYKNFFSWLKGLFQKTKERGAWDGNDTIWRMVVDLYMAFALRKRSCFSVIDGIVAGEGKGPFCPFSKQASTLIAGNDLLAVDAVASRFMGFDPKKIHYLNYFFERGDINYSDVKVIRDGVVVESFFTNRDRYLDFMPPENWKTIKYCL